MFNLGASEIAVILVVALLFLGPKMLPEIATGLGKIIREFRKATADIRQDIELDDVIRRPLQELRDAATLPPEELKRRDEIKAAQRKAELAAQQAVKEDEERRKREADEAERKDREAKEAAEAAAKLAQEAAKAEAAAPPAVALAQPAEVITPNGTMIASPPPADELRTLTPLPDLTSPPPLAGQPGMRLPPPLPRSPRPLADAPADATVVDLHAQLKAAVEAHKTIAGRPGPLAARAGTEAAHPATGAKDEGKKG